MYQRSFIVLSLIMSLLYAPAAALAHNDSGSYYWADGSYYGQLQNGVPSGYGTGTYVNGETYTGQWSSGLMNGHGTYRWTDGKMYVGDWSDGHMNGQGFMIYNDGSTYSGDFYQDRATGNGTKYTPPINVFWNNKPMKFQVNPFMVYNRVMVPVRSIFEASSASVAWDEGSQTVKINKDSTKMVLTVDSVKAQVNGNSVNLDVAPVAYNNRVFIPLRFVSENLGSQVQWDANLQTVFIISGSSLNINDSTDTNTTDVTDNQVPGPADGHVAPTLTGRVVNGHIELAWNVLTAKDLDGYKVVISQSNAHPSYPNDGYLFYITDRYKTTAVVDNSSGYNGGDFGGKLQSGVTYYFSITALYSGHSIKMPGNVIRLTYP